MLEKRSDGSLFFHKIEFTKQKRLPRKRKKTLKRILDRDKRLLKEWGVEY